MLVFKSYIFVVEIKWKCGVDLRDWPMTKFLFTAHITCTFYSFDMWTICLNHRVYFNSKPDTYEIFMITCGCFDRSVLSVHHIRVETQTVWPMILQNIFQYNTEHQENSYPFLSLHLKRLKRIVNLYITSKNWYLVFIFKLIKLTN